MPAAQASPAQGRGNSSGQHYSSLDVEQMPQEARKPEYGISDVFWWRDVPDWYYKTFTSAGFMLCYSLLKQFMDRHELEVFLPPRAKVLPENMRRGYRNREILRQVVYKTGLQTTAAAACAGIFFGGAYYLGQYRGTYSWTDFTASGAAASGTMSVALLRPVRLRLTLFGTIMGGALGSAVGYAYQSSGIPFWDESHDWEGWSLWSGKYIDRKAEKRAGAAAAATATPASSSAQVQPAG